MSSVEGDIRTFDKEHEGKLRRDLDLRCENVQKLIALAKDTADSELSAQRKVLKECERQFSTQQSEIRTLEARCKSDLATVVSVVPTNVVLLDEQQKSRMENLFLECEHCIAEQYTGLENEESKISMLSDRLQRTGEELKMEKQELEQFRSDMEYEIKLLEKKMEGMHQSAKTALEEKKKNVYAAFKAHEIDVSRRSEALVARVAKKQHEVRDAIQDLRSEIL